MASCIIAEAIRPGWNTTAEGNIIPIWMFGMLMIGFLMLDAVELWRIK